MRSKIDYLFIEKNPDRSKHLESVLKGRQERLPGNCSWQVINSTFDETLTSVLDEIEQQRKRLAPAFVMIDPFGVSETPMRTIARILCNPKSEVYISFMYGFINRFREHPNFESNLDELFGCPEWRKGIDIVDFSERKQFFFDMYKSQLKKNGAKYVIHFELYEGERLVYAIFFGTSNPLGCDKMKQAIWQVAPFGDFRFRSRYIGQLMLGDGLVDFSVLERDLQQEFRSREWQTIEDIEDFVKSDATDFHSGHLRSALRAMEDTGDIEVRRPTRQGRRNSATEAQQLAFTLNDVAQPRRAIRNFPAGTSILFR